MPSFSNCTPTPSSLGFSYIGQSIFCVSCEAGDGLRYDEVNLLELTHANHPLKFITGFAFHASKPFIGEDVHQFPIVACSDAFFGMLGSVRHRS